MLKRITHNHSELMKIQIIKIFCCLMLTIASSSSFSIPVNLSDAAISGQPIVSDFDVGIWEIPAKRMKGKVRHTVPLSDQSITVLRGVKLQQISEYVFPNTANGKSLSQAGMSSVIKRMGRAGQITVHGFRSTFRDYIAEKTELDGSIAG